MQTFCLVSLIFIISAITSAAQTNSKSGDDSTKKPVNEPASPQAELAEQTAQPHYKLLQSEEDWSFLTDKSKQSDYLDSIKYIRLRGNRAKNYDDWFLTLGGEIRPFYENFRSENFGQSVPDNNGYLLQRYMLHANLRLSRNFRAFAELKSG